MHSLTPAGVSWRLRYPGLLAIALLMTACVHSPPTPTPPPPDTRTEVVDPEPFQTPAAVTLEKPAVTHPKPNVCADPANYPPPAFDLPQLSAAQLMALFDSPSNARELLGNIKLLAERDLLVQSVFFDEQVLLKFFGASQLAWEKERRSAPFSSHQIELVPQQNGGERPTHPGGRRMFSDEAGLLWINITQAERDL